MTIMVDEDGGCMMGTLLPPPPGWVPPTIAESLAHGFDEQTVYYDYEGRPVALWPDWDYAEDWSVHPLRELHPFIPLIYGKEITQEDFLRMVKAIHGLT
jgi:hypothetical protein